MREKAGPEAQGAGPRGPTSAASPLAARASRAGSLPPEECAERLGERRARGGFYDCGWRSRLPWRPTTEMRAPRRARCCSGLHPGAKPINQSATLERGARAPEFADGLLRPGSSRRRKSEGAPAPASPGQVARRARTLVAGSAAAMAGSPGAPGAASVAGLPPPPPSPGWGSAGVVIPASGCSGLRCSVELPAPMASPRFSRAPPTGYAFSESQGRGAEREAARPRGPESCFLSRSSSRRAQTANERDALAANSLKEKKKKKKATSWPPPPPPCFPLASSHEHSPDTPCSSISPQAARTQGAARVASQGPSEQNRGATAGGRPGVAEGEGRARKRPGEIGLAGGY